MNLGPAGKALIQSYEKCRLVAYMPTPNDVPTLGWGHTSGVQAGDVCTQEQADTWFAEDIAWVEKCVNAGVKVPLTQNEFDAICSLVFNIGCAQFRTSTLLGKLNASDYDGATEQFKVWNKQSGKELAGLTSRRSREINLFEAA